MSYFVVLDGAPEVLARFHPVHQFERSVHIVSLQQEEAKVREQKKTSTALMRFKNSIPLYDTADKSRPLSPDAL